MRKLFIVLAAAGVSLLGVAAANAGSLTSATLTLTAQGSVIPVTGVGATGNLTGNTATLGAGSFFALSTHLAVPAPATDAVLTIGHNGALTATSGGAVNVTAPASGAVKVYANGGGLTLAVVPIKAGAITTATAHTLLGGAITLYGTGWHLGTAQVASTGISKVSFPNAAGTAVSTAAQSHLTVHGSFNATAGTVTLVTISHVIVAGASPSNTASPTYLTLTYATSPVPEPGTLLLLGAGVAGLALTGRRKKRS